MSPIVLSHNYNSFREKFIIRAGKTEKAPGPPILLLRKFKMVREEFALKAQWEREEAPVSPILFEPKRPKSKSVRQEIAVRA